MLFGSNYNAFSGKQYEFLSKYVVPWLLEELLCHSDFTRWGSQS